MASNSGPENLILADRSHRADKVKSAVIWLQRVPL